MDKFWDLLDKSVIATGVSLVMFGGTACYLWATGQTVPPELSRLLHVVIGAFIGGSAQKLVARRQI